MIPILLLAAACGAQAPPNTQADAKPSTERAEPAAEAVAVTPTVSGRVTLEQLDAMGAPSPSACSGAYGAPVAAFDGGSCRVRGPFPGQLAGAEVGEPASLEVTLARCIADEQCTGVSTAWYGGEDYTAVRGAQPFAEDEGSYGCVVLVACPGGAASAP